MIDWGQFHFLRPMWFLALPPLAALGWLMWRRRSGSAWEAVCDAALLPFILLGGDGRPRRWPLGASAVGALLAVAALAGPSWSRLPQPVFSSQGALVIALDLTRSMEAADLSPSRLARARFKIADLLRARKEGQAALLVYAGDAFTVTPLTDDSATILEQLPAITTDIMPAAGNRTDLALTRALDLLRQAGRSRGDVLLISDEVDEARAMPAALALRGHGYRLSVLGVGTEQGAPVTLPRGGFIKDARGEIVIAALDEAPMQRLAAAGGGVYARLSLDDSDLAALSAEFASGPAGEEARTTGLKTDVWEEQGPWLVLLLLPLAALAFRRGVIAVLLLALLPLPRPAEAFDWESLWLRPDQQAKRALDAGDAAHAAKLFNDPAWKGAAQYRAGAYADAAAALQNAYDAAGLYNRGNALARLGRFAEAIAAYDQALKRDPGDADAKFNKELVQKELQRQSPPPQSQAGGRGQEGQPQPSQGDQSGPPARPPTSGADKGAQTAQTPPSRPGDRTQSSPQPGVQPGADGQGQDSQGAASPAQDSQARESQAQESQAQESQTQREGQQSAAGADAGQAVPGKAPPDKSAPASIADKDAPDEKEQAAEQWLRRIPDDPGGLLRRKFLYQYQRRHEDAETGAKTW